MHAATVVDFELGLWWVAVTSTAAAVATTAGALMGIRAHRWPRTFLAGAIWFIAFSYWLDLFAGPGVGAEIRRGGGFLLWPSLAATALTGVLYARKAVARQQAIMDQYDRSG